MVDIPFIIFARISAFPNSNLTIYTYIQIFILDANKILKIGRCHLSRFCIIRPPFASPLLYSIEYYCASLYYYTIPFSHINII